MGCHLPKFKCYHHHNFKKLLSVAVSVTLATGLTGCAGMPPAVTASQQVAQQNGKSALWQEHKSWLLSKLPRAEYLAHEILSALNDQANKTACSSDETANNCDNNLGTLGQKLSQYKVQALPTGLGRGHIAVIDGDTAYVFRLSDATFSGIADVPNSLYFSVASAPLKRTDGRSFAFVADEESDATSVWSLHKLRIFESATLVAKPVEEFPLTRSELDAAGVPKQVDLLTPPQRNERDLVRQGLSWRRRTQIEASKVCSNAERPLSKKDGGKGKHSHASSSEVASAQATPPVTMTEALQGKAHLNCKTGTGFVASPDGIVGEVYRLIKDREGTDAVIAATAKELSGGVIRYRYPVGQESFNTLLSGGSGDMLLQLETAKGDSKLEISLWANGDATAVSLLLPGEWYQNPGYRIGGRDLSSGEFAALFLKAFRDCAVKDGQGNCKNIPDLFMSFLNSDNAADFVKYLKSHYLAAGVSQGGN